MYPPTDKGRGHCCTHLTPWRGDRCRGGCVTGDQSSNQETAIIADVALYWKLNVDPTYGTPYGCEGLDDPGWLNGTIGGVHDPKCPKEDYAPEGIELYKIVDTYADDQQQWVSEFYDALEIMLENGRRSN